MQLQERYILTLRAKFEEDVSFRNRVITDTQKRMPMYQIMYRGIIDKMVYTEMLNFLVSRTIRTMAQYLVLGRLISQSTNLAIIINHPTLNIGLYNDLNKFKLPEDTKDFQPIPVFKLLTKVY